VGAQILAESFGRGLSEMAPGSIEGLQVVVDDINAARADLVEGGRGQRGPGVPASNRLRSRSGEMWRVEGHRGDIPDGTFLRQFVGVHRACGQAFASDLSVVS